jgi:hypothetical protein
MLYQLVDAGAKSGRGGGHDLADSSKFERQALFHVFSLAQMTAGITDDLFDPIVAANYPVPIIRVPVTRTPL